MLRSVSPTRNLLIIFLHLLSSAWSISKSSAKYSTYYYKYYKSNKKRHWNAVPLYHLKLCIFTINGASSSARYISKQLKLCRLCPIVIVILCNYLTKQLFDKKMITTSQNHEVPIQNIPTPNSNFGTHQNFANRQNYDALSRGGNFCLDVFGIPEEVPDEVLINIFSTYGTLISLEVFPRCNIGPSYALLGYADALSAVAAMRSLDGKRVFTDKEELW